MPGNSLISKCLFNGVTRLKRFVTSEKIKSEFYIFGLLLRIFQVDKFYVAMWFRVPCTDIILVSSFILHFPLANLAIYHHPISVEHGGVVVSTLDFRSEGRWLIRGPVPSLWGGTGGVEPPASRTL